MKKLTLLILTILTITLSACGSPKTAQECQTLTEPMLTYLKNGIDYSKTTAEVIEKKFGKADYMESGGTIYKKVYLNQGCLTRAFYFSTSTNVLFDVQDN